jgi:hypothetical protein
VQPSKSEIVKAGVGKELLKGRAKGNLEGMITAVPKSFQVIRL